MGAGTWEGSKRTGVIEGDGIRAVPDPGRSFRALIGSGSARSMRGMDERTTKGIPRAGVGLALVIPFLLLAAATGLRGAAEADPLFLSAADQGSWLAADKGLHFAGSLAIAASLRVEGRARGTALAATFGVGLLKEAYDATVKPRRLRRGASWKDLVADLAGAAAGVAVLSAIDR